MPEPIVFRCKRCRRILANNSNLLLHDVLKSKDTDTLSNLVENASNQQMDQNVQKLLLTSIENSQSERSEETEATVCSDAYFFEPIAWMSDIVNQTQGSLNCPKCKGKLGKFNWVMWSKCPCGKQVSTYFIFYCIVLMNFTLSSKIQPAFYMMPSKIEKSNIVQNVQVTI